MNPRNPPRVYYGWWVVTACFIGLMLGETSVGVFTFGAFVKPLAAEFGWSRADISLARSIIGYTAVAVALPLGFLIDRYGARRLIVPSVLLLALATSSLYFLTDSLAHLYLGYFLIAFLGAATAPLCYSRVVVQWFDRQRGLALGIALAGVGIGAAVMPLFAQSIVTHWGWREAYLALGILIVVVALPVVAFVLVDSPDAHASSAVAHANADLSAGLGIREAAATGSFWLMAPAFLIMGVFTSGIVAHLIPLLTDRGVQPAQAAGIAATLGMSLVAGRVLAGHLMDRFFAPYVTIAFLIGPMIGFTLLAMGAGTQATILAVVLIGLAFGAEIDVISYFTSRYFGVRNFGRIAAIMYALFQFGAGAGPWLMGRGFDTAGSYEVMLYVFAGLSLLAAVLVAFLGSYRFTRSLTGR